MAENSGASKQNVIKVVAAIAVLVIAVVLLTRGGGGGGQTFAPGDYLYDLDSGQVVTESGARRPVAIVVTCGACTTDEWKVAFIRKNEDGQDYVAAPPAPGAKPKWVRAEFPEGRAIAEKFMTMCGGEGATPCRPVD